ncbi:MAG: hypothetical protein NVSMB42_06520 [Herpetosiphon sp.]
MHMHSQHCPRLVPRAAAIITLLATIAILGTTTVAAHPLGNFTVNRYSRLEIARDRAEVRYILDMAEIPTFQERQTIDEDHDGEVSTAEQSRYLARQVPIIRDHIHLLIAGNQVPLTTREQLIEFPEGQGGLPTMRLSILFLADLPAGDQPLNATYRDDNYAGRIGWQEIVVRGTGTASVLASDAPTTDRSAELRNYPQDMLQNPPTQSSATFRFQPGVAGLKQAPQSDVSGTAPARVKDRFASLITAESLAPMALLLTILLAFALGAMHALAPGHGKTVVAAYLVGSRGTARHAVFLGITTTVTHTFGVFALGLVTLGISQYVLPEQLYPWLGALSGLLVVVIGISLFSQRLRGLRGTAPGTDRNIADHTHDDLQAHDHDHNGHTHSHLPPGGDGSPITWRSLLALGISGGLLPCPSALVVLLSAIALHRLALGMLLIVAFSLGLASVLTLIGVALVHAKHLFARVPVRGRLLQLLPAVSAMLITIAGAGITVQALMQTGLLRL